MQPPRPIQNAKDRDEIKRFSEEITDLLQGRLDFGDPTNPAAEDKDTQGNMAGRFLVVTTTTLSLLCVHSLGLSLAGTGPNMKPNVAWLVWGIIHDGTGGGVISGPEYQPGDGIGEEAIVLRLRTDSRTIDASHPATVLLWMQPVGPWPQ